MGAPSINITFIEKAATAVKRGDRGIVMLLVKDTLAPEITNPLMITSISDIPATLSEATKEQIKMTILGYVNAPKKILVYCMGIENEESIEEKYAAALEAIETIKWNYLAVPTVQTDGKSQDIATWIKTMRDNKKRKFKAVLPHTKADNEGVINYTVDENVKTEMLIKDGKTEVVETIYTAEQYCARIAGLIAGTPLTIACTYAPLTDLTDCTRLTDIDTPVDNGELIIFYDGEKVKVVRGVNSLTTTTDTKGDSFKKIKIVETMDMIHDDLTKTIQDSYLGKYANSYDNKCILLTAISGYFKQLLVDGLISQYSVELDSEATKIYLESKGVDTSELSDDEIKMADTGAKVFLKANCKILDAIEEVEMPIYI